MKQYRVKPDKRVNLHEYYVVAEHIVRALEDMDPRPPRIQGIDWKKLRRDLSET